MRFRLKPLSKDSIPAALARAQQLLLRGQPWDADSVCRDILRQEARHQGAVLLLLQALADQFQAGTVHLDEAVKHLAKLDSDYERQYQTGVVYMRWARSQHATGQAGTVTYDWFVEALKAFERAEAIRPPGNDEAVLAWNSCVRSIQSDTHLRHNLGAFDMEG